MTAGKTPGQVSWTARNLFLAGPGDQPGDVLAELDGAWDCLTPEEQEAEEVGARAASAALEAENRALRAELGRMRAEELARADAACADDSDCDEADPHRDLDAGENGGAMTGGDYYDRIAAGDRENEQHARDMAAEDGDLDDCEPTL